MLVILIVATVISHDSNFKIEYKSLAVIEQDEWTIYKNGEQQDNRSSYAIKNNETWVFTKEMTKESYYDDEYIVYLNPSLEVTVYVSETDQGTVDDQILYQTEETTAVFGDEYGDTWQKISCKDFEQGQYLRIEFQNHTGRTKTFLLSETGQGNSAAVFLYLLRKSAFAWVTSVICFTLFIIMIVYLFVLKYKKIEFYVGVFLNLAFFALAFGLWVLGEASIIQFLVESPMTKYYLMYFSYVMLLPLGMAYYGYELSEGKKLFRCLIFIYLFEKFFMLICMLTDYVEVSHSRVFDQIYILVSVIIGYVYCVRTYKRKRTGQMARILIGATILLVGTVLALGSYYVSGLYATNVTRIYVLAYIVYVMAVVLADSSKEFQDEAETKRFRELVWNDKVTMGHTVQFFKDHMDEFNKKDRYFVLMNIPGFSILNQSLGHDNVNKLIRVFYQRTVAQRKVVEFAAYTGDGRFMVYMHANSLEELHEFIYKQYIRSGKELLHEFPIAKLKPTHGIFPIKEDSQLEYEDMMDAVMMAYGNPHAIHWSDVQAYVFTSKCKESLIEEKQLEKDLDDAIKEHQLKVYLQPKVQLSTGKATRAEALVRWQHPTRGFMPPGLFVPLFEKNHIIGRVDLYLFEQTVVWINSCLDRGIEPPVVSCNVSKEAFFRGDIWGYYFEVLEKNAKACPYLELELTESVAYTNFAQVEEVISLIHDYGCGCSMDDFGKDYSNFNALVQLPFDQVKMDKCLFDDGFPEQGQRVKFIEDMMLMFKHMGLEVVAEGIERKEQVEALKKIDCDYIQGYYYSPPVDIKEYEEKWM